MDRYRQPALRQLMDQQVRFAPVDRRQQQADRAETLLAEIDPDKKYPYQLVCYRILDFRPDSYPGLVLDGLDLVHDLRVFIEDLSASTRLDALAVGEPVLTVDELSRKLNVSTKTITRWRNRGLVSRRFVIGGRTRVGFLQSSVDRFVTANDECVERGARFSHLDDGEKDDAIRRARRMVHFCPAARPAEIIRRIARKLRRSPETVRYTLKNYDAENPTRAVFGRNVGPLGDAEKAAIYQAHRRDASADMLARRYSKTKTTIYRVINELRARHVLEQKFEYVSNDLFERPDADEIILAVPSCEHNPDQDAEPEKRSRAPSSLPSYLAGLYEIPLLTKEQEVYLFRKLNYLKFKAFQLRAKLDAHAARSVDLDEIERLQKDALAVKNQIIRANLRLVVSIAKRHIASSASFDELVSDGNMSLIRAVEKFDYARGNKFSTYASWAIMKNFARSIPDEHQHRDRFVTGHDEMFEAATDTRSSEHEYERQVVRLRGSIAKILERLDERERSIIISRFGLEEGAEPQTLEAVGNELGVTKERVRQLEVRAMDKLRQFADEEHIELPDD